jgi:hypothetical protein
MFEHDCYDQEWILIKRILLNLVMLHITVYYNSSSNT